MNKYEQFKIDSLEELKEAYKHFKDEWDENFSLESEMGYFMRFGYRFITYKSSGMFLFKKRSYYRQIPNPLKQMKQFTISGSPALKKAFCEEAGLEIDPFSVSLEYNGRFQPHFNDVYFSPSIIESDNHFHLPDNYQEALEFVKKDGKWAEIEKETYSIGDVFKDTTNDDTYILSEVDEDKVQLTCLEDGEAYLYGAGVSNRWKITTDEMEEITGGDLNDFEKIPTKIK